MGARESEILLLMLVTSPGHTQILVANDNACRLLGYSSHDLIGQKLTQFFLKPDCDVVEALSEEHVEADGHAAVVFGTVVRVGVGTGCPVQRAAGAQLGGRGTLEQKPLLPAWRLRTCGYRT